MGLAKHTIGGQRADRHPTALVAVNVLDENIVRGRLDTDAFVTICDLNIMHVAVVGADNINPISPAHIRSSNGDLIGFHIGYTVEDQVECRGVNKDDIVNRDVGARDESKESGILAGCSNSSDVPLAIDST